MRGYRGQPRLQSYYYNVWRRAFFMTWGFVAVQTCLFSLRHSYFCFSSTTCFFKKFVTRNKILHFVSRNTLSVKQKNKTVNKAMPDNNFAYMLQTVPTWSKYLQFKPTNAHSCHLIHNNIFKNVYTPTWDLRCSGKLRSYIGNSMPKFRATDRVSRNVGTELPLYAAQFLRRAHIPSTSRRKSEIIPCYMFRPLLVHQQNLYFGRGHPVVFL